MALLVFCLPWQTRVLFGADALGSEAGEYGVWSVYAVELLMLLILVLRGRFQLSREANVLQRPVLLFLGGAFLSATLALTPGAAFAFLHLFFAALLFFLLFDTRNNPRILIGAFLLSLLIPAGLAFVQSTTGGSPASSLFGLASRDSSRAGDAVVQLPSGERLLRAYGSLSHPNDFGGLLVVGLLTLIFLWPEQKGRGWRMLRLASAVFLGAALLITFSRSAWLGFIFGTLVFLVGMKRGWWKGARIWKSSLLAALIGLGCAGFMLLPELTVRVRAEGRLEEKSLSERQGEFGLWKEVIASDPFVGVGPGRYVFALQERDPGRPVWSYQPIHNTFLLMLSELGLLGMIAMVFLLWRARTFLLSPFFFALLPAFFLDHYLWTAWTGLVLLAFAAWLSTFLKNPLDPLQPDL